MSFDNPGGVANSTKKRVVGRPWPKGVSGNPSGRPPKSLMQRKLEEKANDPKFVDEWIDAAIKRSKAPGVAGYLQTREIMDRVDGPVKQEMELSGNVSVSLADAINKRRRESE